MNNLSKDVTFVFYCKERESANLKIRLQYDGLRQSEFFRAILKMYVSNDEAMMKVVEKIKEEKKTMGKKKRKRSLKEIKEGEDLMRALALSRTEKEHLFDLIETEPGEDYG